MLATCELRWFFDATDTSTGADTAWVGAVRTWLEESGAVKRERERIDRYLATNDDALGIKMRGSGGPSKLEAKLRTHELGVCRFGGLEGRVERWRKWTLVDDVRAVSFSTEEGAIDVTKRRLSGLFVVDAGGVRPATEGADVEEGCLFEVTELSAPRAGVRASATVGFEAFGPDGRALPVLARVAEHVAEALMARQPSLRLHADASRGYPAWLAVHLAALHPHVG
jgi:hypothetical protein